MWTKDLQEQQLAVIRGKKAPTIVIQNVTYLHAFFKQWKVGNIWIDGDRIVYVGTEMPNMLEGTEVIDGSERYAVPGYIEPHTHPAQLYNMESFANYAAQTGTTGFISDNLLLHMQFDEEMNEAMHDELQRLPYALYWWSRLDSQTALHDEAHYFNREKLKRWMARPDVIMGGEVTAWPVLLNGDERMSNMVALAKQNGLKVEGHLPGASERTLAQLKLLGIDGDHESMTLEDVEKRLQHGYAVTLRHSSIRPDLADMLKGVIAEGWDVWDQFMMTTDGSSPLFHETGVINDCIQVAIDVGVEPMHAYLMASYNPARYYNLSETLGVIATGRRAMINLLQDPRNATPVSVLSDGRWIVKDGEVQPMDIEIDWSMLGTLETSVTLTEDLLTPMTNLGISLENDVITKPYESELDLSVSGLNYEHDESFLTVISRDGKIRMSSVIKGFADHIDGIATSYSNTGDFIIIGKNKKAMIRAFNEVLRMQGGYALVEGEEVVASIPTPIAGSLPNLPVEQLIEKERHFKNEMQRLGYRLNNFVFTFLFLQSMHLPFIRITRQGMMNVLKREVLVPAQK
ncbi:adenine deaminase C-terminal domain-containing protein [Savagea faecisuis]|uniref:adenine deaminase n=1 Tax=Savagea faecisuis TaxID=1274803 RepID=A0ABW3GZ88_9BACL